MQTVLIFLRKFPWWLWVVIFLVVILSWQSLSGWSASRKYFNLLLDQIRQDQSKIIQDRDTQIVKFEADVKKLEKEKLTLQKDKLLLQKQSAQSTAEINRLRGTVNDLKNKLDQVVISDDINTLISDLHRMGFGTVRLH